MASFAVILLAAGSSNRFGGKQKKQFVEINGRATWLHSLERFSKRDDIDQTIVVVNANDRELFDIKFNATLAFLGNAQVVNGGAERVDSVQNALESVSSNIDFVAIHDTARPCVSDEMIEAVFAAAQKTGAAILAAPATDTIKRHTDSANPQIAQTVPRDDLWLAQTPQVFARDVILKAYANRKRGDVITDDASLVENIGHPVQLVASDQSNLKITRSVDVTAAGAILSARDKARSAKGPVHPFASDNMWR